MNYIIDAHEDLAYNAFSFSRDYTRSAQDTREREKESPIPQRAGQTLLGWPDYQRGRVGMVFGTLFLSPPRHPAGPWETQIYKDLESAARLYRGQIDYYRRLADDEPQKFRLVRSRTEMAAALRPWQQNEDKGADNANPVGLVLLMEGAEGIRRPEELEEYWQMGLRIVGPVWAGGRFCGGTHEPGGFTSEGRQLLEIMADLGYVLDVSHMNEQSMLTGMESYPGAIIASHANARAMIRNVQGERHLTDRTIRLLAERGGVMGVLPFNGFLLTGWKPTDDRRLVTLDTLIAHIDHICQLTGSAAHVAIGTDFDGGFGWPSVPVELDTIGDLPGLEQKLLNRGYSVPDVEAIFHGNWQRILESSLP